MSQFPVFNDGIPVVPSGDVVPLFVADMDLLRSRLRLSGTASPDALTMIDFAVQRVRVGVYSSLTEQQIADIVASPSVPNPTTQAQAMRSLAEAVEVLWVRYILMQELPHMFMDGSGRVLKDWNEEGLTRDSGNRAYEKMLESLWNQILDGLSQLSAGTLGATSDMNLSTLGPTRPQPRPGKMSGLPWPRPTDRLFPKF